MYRSAPTRAETLATYDTIADEWDRTRQRGWGEFQFLTDRIRRRETHDLSRRADKRIRILDAGCGNGRLVEFLDRELAGMYGYLGVDGSVELLKKARAKFPDLAFEQADLVDFRRDREFDVVASFAVLHHLPSADERLAILKNFYATLADGGDLVLSVWNLWQPRYLPAVVKSYLAGTPRECMIPFANRVERYVHACTPRELRELAATVGFTHIDVFYADGATRTNALFGRNLVLLAKKGAV